MLRNCTKTEFDLYVDFAYELATNIEKSAYPTYCDGLKTKEMFMERLSKAFERDTEEVLLFEIDGKIEGLIHYQWLPKDNYVATCSFNINTATGQALSEFIAYVREKCKGYDLYLGFPADNKVAIQYFEKQAFECIEDDYNNIAFMDKISVPSADKKLTRINKDNYHLFKILHDQIEGDMYWNSERIFEDLDHWVIYVEQNNDSPQGAIYYMDETDGWLEIFGVDMDGGVIHQDIFRDLLIAALSDAKNKGGRVMTFFCDEDGEQTALECGFTCVGRYLCYKLHLD